MGICCNKPDLQNKEFTAQNSVRESLRKNEISKQEQIENVKTINSTIPQKESNQKIDKKDEPKLKSTRTKQMLEGQKDIKINTTVIVNKTEGSPAEHYVIEKKLGEGSYGEVYKVRQKSINVVRAMKKIIRKDKSKDKENEKEVENEINLLKQIDHPNVVKIFEFYQTKQAYFIITEFCNGGELFDKIISNGPFTEVYSAYIMYQVLSAVLYCHNMNILHRDLKPENILIDQVEKDGFLNIKVIDFGTAKIFDKDRAEKKVIGSAYYIAPEVLEKNYNNMCDLWSCGVILYILLTGKPPFGGSDDEIQQRIKIGKYDESDLSKCTKESRNLIRKLLELNPKKRITASDALNHEFFKVYKIKEMFNNISDEKIIKALNNLKKFEYEGKIQEAAFAFLVHNSLHLEEVKDIYKVFKRINKAGNGKINKKELKSALKEYLNSANPDKETNKIFDVVDNDNNEYIEYEEFIRACIEKEHLLGEKILKYTFDFFDKDGSGDITLEEMKAIFGDTIKEDMLKRMIEKIDLDNNNSINLDEFKQMMSNILVEKNI